MIKHTNQELELAKQMAESVNGGRWETSYTDAQRSGWILKVRWSLKNIAGIAQR